MQTKTVLANLYMQPICKHRLPIVAEFSWHYYLNLSYQATLQFFLNRHNNANAQNHTNPNNTKNRGLDKKSRIEYQLVQVSDTTKAK